jgi:regulatory protein
MGLYPDVIADSAKIREAALREQPPTARRDTERFLSKSEHTMHQLGSYLIKRKYLDKVVSDTLKWAERNGLIDDRRYASIYIRSHSHNSPMGDFRIRMELKKRGVSGSITDELLSEREESDLYRILVKTIIEKYGYLEKEKALRRATGYLQRRGFRYDLIGRVVNEALRNPEERSD